MCTSQIFYEPIETLKKWLMLPLRNENIHPPLKILNGMVHCSNREIIRLTLCLSLHNIPCKRIAKKIARRKVCFKDNEALKMLIVAFGITVKYWKKKGVSLFKL